MHRVIRQEWLTRDLPGFGPIGMWVPVVPEAAPPVVREGVARLRLCATDSTCPCGGTPYYPSEQERQLLEGPLDLSVRHEDGCPADPELLREHGWSL